MAESHMAAIERRAREAMGNPPPAAGAIWSERLTRAVDELGAEGMMLRSDTAHAYMRVRCTVGSDQVLVEGEWVDGPHKGDEKWARAEARRLWGELGERLGIGPPPSDFFGEDS